MIPKIIYAAWCGPDPLPTKDCFLESWRKKLPGYEIHLLTDKDVPSSACTRAMSDRRRLVNVAQYMCWAKLYETGGIYLDLDVDIIRPFDDLLEHDAFLAIENDRDRAFWACCGVLGAKPRHLFIRECLDYMDHFDFTHPKIENEIGPRMFTSLLIDHGWKPRDADVTVADVRILKSTRFYPYTYMQKFTPECVTDETYAVHKWAYTWKHKVSVVIPCYNQGRYLGEAIESALAQTEAPIEVIVVDDGSTDDTARVAGKYPVKLIRQKNRGVSAARNAGIAVATGQSIVCLDADDRLRPEFIAKLNGLDDIVSCDVMTFGAKQVKWAPPLSTPKLADFLRSNHAAGCSLFNRDFWEKVGGYDEEGAGLEDWDFWTRCVHAGASVWVAHEVLLDYRVYADGDRIPTSNSWETVRSNGAEAAMRSKWAELGITTVPRTTAKSRLRYPIRIGVRITVDGVVYDAGSRIDRETALAAKASGQLKDARIA